jgi:hypothetical protein
MSITGFNSQQHAGTLLPGWGTEGQKDKAFGYLIEKEVKCLKTS